MAFPAIGAILSRIAQTFVGRAVKRKGLSAIVTGLKDTGAEVAAAKAKESSTAGGPSLINRMADTVRPAVRKAGNFVLEDDDAPDNARALTQALSRGASENPSGKHYPAYAQPPDPAKVKMSPPPRPPRSQGGVRDRVGQFVRGLQQQREDESNRRREATSLRQPIDTSGMSLKQRSQRLETAGKLLTRETASRELGGVEITGGIKQVVQASEKAEQRSRNKAAKRLENLPAGAGPFAKLGQKFKWVGIVSGVAIGLVSVLAKLRVGLRRSGEAHAESQRKYARYNMVIANVMAKLDRQNLVLESRTSKATGASGSAAVKTKMWADRMGQENRETIQTAVNGLSALTQIGRSVLEKIIENNHYVQIISMASKLYEKFLGDPAPDKHVFLAAMGDFIQQQNNQEGHNRRPGGMEGRGENRLGL